MSIHTHNYPKLHNAMWPGLVGKGSPGAEPCLDLDTMLDLTAAAEVDGIKFDGVDIFLYEPHIAIDISDDDLKRIADKIAAKGLVVGSVVAPIWPPTGGGSAMGSEEERKNFVRQVLKGCHIAAKLRQFGVRPHGVVRLDSASSVEAWTQDPEGNTRLIAQTFRQACDVAESFGERLAAEGEICWGAMHSWRAMVNLLEAVDRPQTLGFQADMAHTLLFTLGFNAPEDAILPQNWDWSDPARLDAALKTLTAALRPWTIDFHVAQNDATVKGSGTHDKTGHHCLPNDPNGKLDIPRHASFWLRDESGNLTKAFRHICWDGCMFSNAVMMQPQTWNDILAAMIAVRDAHGWTEAAPAEVTPAAPPPVAKRRGRPPKKAVTAVEAQPPESLTVGTAVSPESVAPAPVASVLPLATPVEVPPAEGELAVPETVPPAPVAAPKRRGRPPKQIIATMVDTVPAPAVAKPQPAPAKPVAPKPAKAAAPKPAKKAPKKPAARKAKKKLRVVTRKAAKKAVKGKARKAARKAPAKMKKSARKPARKPAKTKKHK